MQGTLFELRFLDDYAGQIIRDPAVALLELVANAWDAYATSVAITWPDGETLFAIEDNGIGMTASEVDKRWRTFSYDRLRSQGGEYVDPPSDSKSGKRRRVFGRNGKGRFAGFYFCDPYRVTTWRDGQQATFEVARGISAGLPFDLKMIGKPSKKAGHGCKIAAVHLKSVPLTADDARALLSTRFLTDPEFRVTINGQLVTFDDVPDEALQIFEIKVEPHGVAKVRVIDGKKSDKTTRQHGVALWVNRRLVGECSWRWIDQERLLDGRTEEAKRYTFIVEADFLLPDVTDDWTGVRSDGVIWKATKDPLQTAIIEAIRELTKERRAAAKDVAREAHAESLKKLTPMSRERWVALLDEVVEKCPGLGEAQVIQVMGLAANMERSQSKYALLEKLSGLKPGEIDELNELLAKWTVRTAKYALDEIEGRLRVIEELRAKTSDRNADEVRELQPLFENALWIFGPEFESIEFTSNETMATVIRRYLKGALDGSRNRPDFVMTPDSSLGFYSLPDFDRETHNVTGVRRLVIVELKRPGVTIGSDEKGQVWKYVKELVARGLVTDATTVTGFVLGEQVDPTEVVFSTHGKNVSIRPLLYSSFILQAEKRMFNLRKRLQEAPFLKDKGLVEFVKVDTVGRDLFTRRVDA